MPTRPVSQSNLVPKLTLVHLGHVRDKLLNPSIVLTESVLVFVNELCDPALHPLGLPDDCVSLAELYQVVLLDVAPLGCRSTRCYILSVYSSVPECYHGQHDVKLYVARVKNQEQVVHHHILCDYVYQELRHQRHHFEQCVLLQHEPHRCNKVLAEF